MKFFVIYIFYYFTIDKNHFDLNYSIIVNILSTKPILYLSKYYEIKPWFFFLTQMSKCRRVCVLSQRIISVILFSDAMITSLLLIVGIIMFTRIVIVLNY